jgi:hypothetical protein
MTSAVMIRSRLGRDGQASGVADDCRDLVPGRERLLGEACSGCAGGAEDCQFHGGCLL